MFYRPTTQKQRWVIPLPWLLWPTQLRLPWRAASALVDAHLCCKHIRPDLVQVYQPITWQVVDCTVSEMTYTVSSGAAALNSTQSNPSRGLDCIINDRLKRWQTVTVSISGYWNVPELRQYVWTFLVMHTRCWSLGGTTTDQPGKAVLTSQRALYGSRVCLPDFRQQQQRQQQLLECAGTESTRRDIFGDANPSLEFWRTNRGRRCWCHGIGLYPLGQPCVPTRLASTTTTTTTTTIGLAAAAGEGGGEEEEQELNKN